MMRLDIFIQRESIERKNPNTNRYNNASGNTFETIDVIKVEVPINVVILCYNAL